MKRLGKLLLDLLFPRPECMVCGHARGVDGGLCPACREGMPPFEGGYVGLIQNPYAPFAYEGAARELIHRMKYGGEPDLAARFFAPHMAKRVMGTHDLIVPVPIAGERLAQRGYNQAEVLARHLGRAMGVPVKARALRFNGRHASQTHLSRQERLDNMRRAILPGRGDIKGQRILLVDDVVTTGATLYVCLEVLLRMGARGVAFACACAVPRQK